MTSLDDARNWTADGAGMDAQQTTAVLELLMGGELAADKGGDLLRRWAARGETGTELAAAVRFLKQHAVAVPVVQPCFDVCGTGGSGLERFNVSTTVAFIAAAAGVPVAKHGNRGSRKPNGSFDLLEALGIPFDLPPEAHVRLQDETGVCFLFARSHHPAVGRVVPYRKAAGGRTIFNLAGPLANPAPIARQIIGTIAAGTAEVVAEALQQLGTTGALVVWGEPGIDEISVTGRTDWLRIAEDRERGHFDQPLHPDLDYAALPGGDATENADLFRRLLDGEDDGPLLDMVCINAGAAIDLWHDRPPRFDGPGCSQARELVVSGAVRDAYDRHRSLARSLAS